MIQILQGDCLERLRELPEASVQCVVTSPPYWGLRDYGVAGQIGLERTPEEYVAKIVDVFREVRRVLRKDGTCWLNLGDSYTASGCGGDTGKSGLQGSTESQDASKRAKSSQSFRRDKSFVGNVKHMAAGGLRPKQLVGIPWRVAFALQAPQYLGNIKADRDRAWLAALVDGEGCITILETTSSHGSGNSYPPVLQVRMCDAECIQHAAAITGYGNASPIQEPPSQGGQRGSYQWRLNGRKAADTIAEIYPYLLIKRRQAIVAWNHQAIRDSYDTKRGVTIPTAALEKQQICRDLIQKLNARESVDIPSWMVEPPAIFGPGWYLRSDVIWSKPNPMPESVTDRPTKSHEYLFLLTKAERYFYDAEAIKETSSPGTHPRIPGNVKPPKGQAAYENGDGRQRTKAGLLNYSRKLALVGSGVKNNGSFDEAMAVMPSTRNKRSVWTVPTAPYSEAHFATFPPDLIKPCILAGSRPGDVVLDPFGGSGTTGAVALELGRRAILIELNPEYVALAERRCTVTPGLAI